ncbi:putative Foldase protein prsA [Nitrospina gracilis 3/211]|uniref:Putative Foldase protein prsA n=1 Tax=Nitrospina gracilis (strain 3/211) TaxID=1266370 RepID=M1Z8H2_NITG3|nr:MULTISPECIES: peptidylprolyl isomerase [Nitrospina]MCF8722134.1 parvulin-like peptidyl-prolyl isomerase [Nitrospina sp. Nb-3]CCQ89324.1 putative Foldase protein prsA [Nitrospina gracilis 3/211]
MWVSLFRKWTVLAVLVWMVAALPAMAQPEYFEGDVTGDMNLPDVVARVNGVDLESKYIRFELNRMLKDREEAVPLDQRERLALDILDREINRELIFKEGGKSGFNVDAKLVSEQFSKLKENYESEEAFQKALEARGLTEEDIKKSIEVDLTANSLLRDQVKNKIVITDQQVEHFYEQRKNVFQRPEAYRAQHIFVPLIPVDVIETTPIEQLKADKEKYIAEARKKIETVYEKLKAGADFAELARTHSEDVGSAEKGGDLDFIYKGVFDPEIDEAVSRLKIGEVSGIVKSKYGFHILKLNETKPAEDVPLEEVKASIQNYLFTSEAEKVIARYIDSLRKKADIQVFYQPAG